LDRQKGKVVLVFTSILYLRSFIEIILVKIKIIKLLPFLRQFLFTSNNIYQIGSSYESKSAKLYKTAYLLTRTRKRIETLFSQLCDQFMIRRNYAKSFDGYKTRILSKITSVTVIQMINKLLNRNINN